MRKNAWSAPVFIVGGLLALVTHHPKGWLAVILGSLIAIHDRLTMKSSNADRDRRRALEAANKALRK